MNTRETLDSPARRLSLRTYQIEFLKRIEAIFSEKTNDVLLEMPTGSGKTLLTQCVASLLIAKFVFKHIVIVAPQKQIEAGFIPSDLTHVGFSGKNVVLSPDQFTQPDSTSRSASILRYLKHSNDDGRILVATHQAISKWSEDDLPVDLSKALLIIDEAHHVGADGLGQAVTHWHESNGFLLLATATPFRSDNRPVAREGMVRLYRSLSQHLIENTSELSPKRIEHEVVLVGVKTPDITDDEFQGRSVRAENVDKFVTAISENWSKDKRRKVMVRVPILEGNSNDFIKELFRRFEDLGARTFDTTGNKNDTQQNVISFFDSQRDLAYAESHDIILGIQRIIEGTDWPVCTDVFVVGFPSSLAMSIQMLGRATRNKSRGCPEDLAERAKITFFVPFASELQLSRLPMIHSRKAILLAAFLSDTATLGQFAIASPQNLGVTKHLPPEKDDVTNDPDTTPEINDFLDERFTMDQDHANALQVIASLATTKNELKSDHRKILESAMTSPLLDYLDYADRKRILEDVVLKLLSTGSQGKEVKKKLRRKLKQRSINPKLHDKTELNLLLNIAIAEVIEEFRDTTLVDSKLLENYITQMHSISGGDFSKFSKAISDKMAEIQKKPIELHDLHQEIWKFRQEKGKWPNTGSGFCDRFETTWANLNQYLQVGTRGFPVGSSLFKECNVVAKLHSLPEETPIRFEKLSELIILEAIRRYYTKHGKKPSKNSGKIDVGIEALDGNTWSSLAFYARSGIRMEGGKACRSFRELIAIIEQERGQRQTLTNQDIRDAILEHYNKYGEFPTKHSKEPTHLGYTIAQLAEFVVHGKRGTTKSRWTNEINAVKATIGKSFKATDAVWSHDSIKQQIRFHFESTGEFPTLKTKIPSKDLGTWAAIHRNLVEGKHGMPLGTKLSDLVNAVRDEMGLGPSDLDSDQFYRRTEVAKLLGVSEITIRRRVESGQLTFAKLVQGVYLFEKSYIDQLVADRRDAE